MDHIVTLNRNSIKVGFVKSFLATLLMLIILCAPASASPDVSSLNVLAVLPIQSSLPMVGYDRLGEFGPSWTDNNDDEFGHNGCSTRDDILARDLHNVVRQGCVVESGVLDDPYTGKVINFQRGPQSSLVQIDHLVALGDAWITGAQTLSQHDRINLANDPRNLLAVDGHANNIKRDHDASGWLPTNEHFRCTYVSDQITVKTLYHLWVTPAEHDAMQAVLEDCK
jgi:Protein of unknown function (DUF1524)